MKQLTTMAACIALAFGCNGGGGGDCPASQVDSTIAAWRVGSEDPTHDYDCNGAVNANDVRIAREAAEACKAPQRECDELCRWIWRREHAKSIDEEVHKATAALRAKLETAEKLIALLDDVGNDGGEPPP